MLFVLPLDIQKLINEYDEDFIPKKFVIIKQKIEGEIAHTQCYLSKISRFNKIFEVMNDKVMSDLKGESVIGSSFKLWMNNIIKELSIPEDIFVYTQNKRRKLGYNEQLLSQCNSVVNNYCKHTTLLGESDDDYHCPRYEFHCILCHKQVYKCDFKKNTRFV